MATNLSASAPAINPQDLLNASMPAIGKSHFNTNAKAKAAAQDFEAVFINSMFQHMCTDIGGEGPFGGDGAAGVWRSFLTEQYSKSFAKAGGLGMADQVYRSLMSHQEASS